MSGSGIMYIIPKTIATNPHLEAVRAAYRASSAYQRTQGVVTPAVRALIERVPGSDDDLPQAGRKNGLVAGQSGPVAGPAEPALGIPWDSLEVEMRNGGKP